MRIVVDANVICSALISNSNILTILYDKKLYPIGPSLLFEEVEKHLEEIIQKSKTDRIKIIEAFQQIRKRIEIIQNDYSFSEFNLAQELLKGHNKDVQYIALALHFRCPLWTHENRLQRIPSILTLTTKQLKKLLKIK